jgi:chromosome partitioning protein
MLAYTTYSEAGGVGKTTLAANLGVAHARHGRDVLLVDLDPQDASLSHLLDVDDDRADPDVDTLAEHLIGQGNAPLEDIVRSAEGVDIIPTHNALNNLTEWLVRAELRDESFDRYSRLRDVLRESGLADEYDTIIVDPPASEGPHLYNAVVATRALLIPLELSGKGSASIDGLQDLVAGLETELDIDVYAPAVVPVGYDGRLNAHKRHLESIEESQFPVPVRLGSRESLMSGCWDEQCSAFRYVDEHRDYPPQRERETLENIETLARHLEGEP